MIYPIVKGSINEELLSVGMLLGLRQICRHVVPGASHAVQSAGQLAEDQPCP